MFCMVYDCVLMISDNPYVILWIRRLIIQIFLGSLVYEHDDMKPIYVIDFLMCVKNSQIYYHVNKPFWFLKHYLYLIKKRCSLLKEWLHEKERTLNKVTLLFSVIWYILCFLMLHNLIAALILLSITSITVMRWNMSFIQNNANY